jgi:hypothetical protein
MRNSLLQDDYCTFGGHKGRADGYIHACRPKIVSINPSLTLIMAESVAAEHQERGN